MGLLLGRGFADGGLGFDGLAQLNAQLPKLSPQQVELARYALPMSNVFAGFGVLSLFHNDGILQLRDGVQIWWRESATVLATVFAMADGSTRTSFWGVVAQCPRSK